MDRNRDENEEQEVSMVKQTTGLIWQVLCWKSNTDDNHKSSGHGQEK